MKMTIEMPVVAECVVTSCAYNSGEKCHARAITIGDGIHPGCDTSYLGASGHTHEKEHMAGVGACKVTNCAHNDDLECGAESIMVGHVGNDINCLTYARRG